MVKGIIHKNTPVKSLSCKLGMPSLDLHLLENLRLYRHIHVGLAQNVKRPNFRLPFVKVHDLVALVSQNAPPLPLKPFLNIYGGICNHITTKCNGMEFIFSSN